MRTPRIVVAGALANKPHNSGEAWVRMSWVQGLRRLGCQVLFLEELAERTCTDDAGNAAPFSCSSNRRWFDEVTEEFGLSGSAALICDDGSTLGHTREELYDLAADSDLLVNISGNLVDTALRNRFRRRAYIDLDPGFTQLWHSRGELGTRLEGYDQYFSVGANLGNDACEIPVGNLIWRAMLPPVVLEDWPLSDLESAGDRFTTIATWRGPFGPIEWDRRRFGLKVHEFRKFITLPNLVDAPFELALGIHPDERPDLELLAENRWHLVEPRSVAGTAGGFDAYVRGSFAEFSVAQEMYVAARSGWFSDRTTRYLASGRPALVQDTAFSEWLPTGKGLVSFTTLEQAHAGAESILADYPAHAAAARQIAEEYFDSDLVLGDFLEACLG